MKCKDFEQDIYLYSELSEEERIMVTAHMQECAACKELFQVVLSTQTLIAKASVIKPELANHGRLTSSIMQALQKKEINFSLSFLNSFFLKYSMVTISVALIVTFAVEQYSSAEVLPMAQTSQSGTVLLNSVSIAKNLQDRKEKNQLHSTSLYACLKSESCGKTFIESFRKKSL
jgi:predicted anti-sigma-YlaC factor YlaD